AVGQALREEAAHSRIGERIDLAIAVEPRRRPGAEIDHRRPVGVAGAVDRVAQISEIGGPEPFASSVIAHSENAMAVLNTAPAGTTSRCGSTHKPGTERRHCSASCSDRTLIPRTAIYSA